MIDDRRYDPTPEQVERTKVRDEHGRKLAASLGVAAADLSYYADSLAAIQGSSAEERFRWLYAKHHCTAGVAKAVSLALEEMGRENANRYPKPRREFTW